MTPAATTRASTSRPTEDAAGSSRKAPRWPSSPTPATINVGIKFDQPGLGLKDADGRPDGFDVEVAKILVAGLGIDPDERQSSGRRRISDNREPLPRGRQGRLRRSRPTRSPTSAAQSSARPAPTWSPASSCWSRRTTRHRAPEDLKGKEVCSVDRLDLARERQGRGHEAGRASTPTPVRRQGARRHGRGDDHRRHDPGRLRRAERGRAQGRRRASSPRSASASATPRTTPRCASGSSTR